MDKREMGLRRVKENLGIIDCSEYSLSVCPFLPVSCTSGAVTGHYVTGGKRWPQCFSVACSGLKHLGALLRTAVLSSYRQDLDW